MKDQQKADARQELNRKRKDLMRKAFAMPDGKEKDALIAQADAMLKKIYEGGLSGEDAQTLALTY